MTEINDNTGPPGETARPKESLSALQARFEDALIENLDALIELAGELKNDVQLEWDKLREGETSEQRITSKLKGDLPSLLKMAIEVEGQLYGHRINRAGKAGAFALDFGAARSEIGSRLARLRAA